MKLRMPLQGRADRLADWLLAAVLAGSAAVLGGGVLFDGYQASFQGFLASIVALYTVAAYGERRDRIVGAAAVAVALAGFQLAEALRGNDIGEVPGPWLAYLIAFALGRVRGWPLGESKQLRRRAAELERERDEKARIAVQEERARIARELHDIVAHAISIMIVQARVGRRRLAGEPELPRESFDTIEDTGRQALTEMRRLARDAAHRRRAAGAGTRTRAWASSTSSSPRSPRPGRDVELTIEGEPRELPPGDRPVELPDRPGGAHERAQARRTGPPRGWSSATETTRSTSRSTRHRREHRGGSVRGGHGLAGMRERVALVRRADRRPGISAGGGFAVRARLPAGCGAGMTCASCSPTTRARAGGLSR